METPFIKNEDIEKLPRLRKSNQFNNADLEYSSNTLDDKNAIDQLGHHSDLTEAVAKEEEFPDGLKDISYDLGELNLIEHAGDSLDEESDFMSKIKRRKPSSKNKGSKSSAKHNLMMRRLRPSSRIQKGAYSIGFMASKEPPLSLSKLSFGEKQRPLYIDIERILINDKADKRVKITTLDVLKQLIESFQPTQTEKGINEEEINHEFKQHVLYNLRHISDMHTLLGNIMDQINEIQRQKTNLRNCIFNLRKDHHNLGNKLNLLRNDYHKNKAVNKKYNDLCDKMENLSKGISMPEESQGFQDYGGFIERQMHSLSKMMGRSSGTTTKLAILNEKLADMYSDKTS